MKNVQKGFPQFDPSQKFSNINPLSKIQKVVLLSKHFSIIKIYPRIFSRLLLYFKKSKKLTKEYAEAKIKQEQNIAKKIEAQTNLLKIKEIKDFNNIINDIFSDDGLPEIAKALKLAKIIENNNNIIPLLNSTQDIITNQHH